MKTKEKRKKLIPIMISYKQQGFKVRIIPKNPNLGNGWQQKSPDE
jgi:hypothetical protein